MPSPRRNPTSDRMTTRPGATTRPSTSRGAGNSSWVVLSSDSIVRRSSIGMITEPSVFIYEIPARSTGGDVARLRATITTQTIAPSNPAHRVRGDVERIGRAQRRERLVRLVGDSVQRGDEGGDQSPMHGTSLARQRAARATPAERAQDRVHDSVDEFVRVPPSGQRRQRVARDRRQHEDHAPTRAARVPRTGHPDPAGGHLETVNVILHVSFLTPSDDIVGCIPWGPTPARTRQQRTPTPATPRSRPPRARRFVEASGPTCASTRCSSCGSNRCFSARSTASRAMSPRAGSSWRLPDPLPLGAAVRVCFPVPDGSGDVVATGEVKNHYFINYTQGGTSRAVAGMAVRFTSFENESHHVLRRLPEPHARPALGSRSRSMNPRPAQRGEVGEGPSFFGLWPHGDRVGQVDRGARIDRDLDLARAAGDLAGCARPTRIEIS